MDLLISMAGRFILKTIVFLTTILCSLTVVVLLTSGNDNQNIEVVVSEDHVKEKREISQTLRNGGSLEHWLPDWYNETNMESLLSNRNQLIKQRCQHSDHITRNKWKVSIRRLYARFSRITYCATAKAGSTFWRSVIHRVQWMKSDGALVANQHNHPVVRLNYMYLY